MESKNNFWKIIVAVYLIYYFLVSLIIFSITKQGSLVVIALIGFVMISPYIAYNLLKKKQIEVTNEPDINTLY